jgi:hypothetical protein
LIGDAAWRTIARCSTREKKCNMSHSVYSRTFQKAAQLAGGPRKLARHLRVPIADLESWIAGREAPPIPSFLKAVDYVLDETSSPPASEAADPPAPQDCAAADGDSLLP